MRYPNWTFVAVRSTQTFMDENRCSLRSVMSRIHIEVYIRYLLARNVKEWYKPNAKYERLIWRLLEMLESNMNWPWIMTEQLKLYPISLQYVSSLSLQYYSPPRQCRYSKYCSYRIYLFLVSNITAAYDLSRCKCKYGNNSWLFCRSLWSVLLSAIMLHEVELLLREQPTETFLHWDQYYFEFDTSCSFYDCYRDWPGWYWDQCWVNVN